MPLNTKNKRTIEHYIETARAGEARPRHYQRAANLFLNPKISGNIEKMRTNGILGLVGESGELADIFKKIQFQGHPQDIEKIKEELGDVLWYVAELCMAYRLNLDEVMADNIAKLYERYPDGFSEENSINRSNGVLK
jgi:NTP pyrophosphatase (non-canonical NTP hydrolase)